MLISTALADTTNPFAIKGHITVYSSEYALDNGDNIKKYPVANAIDGDPGTTWVYECNSTSKSFAGFLISFDTKTKIDGISLINGYAKSASLYLMNSSVSSFEIIFPNKKKYTFKCNESTDIQKFNFPRQDVEWMIFKVVSERKGTKYNDLCISEISPLNDGIQLMDKQSDVLISNNGMEYESDIIINLKSKKKFNTEVFDFICGASRAFVINDSTILYNDDCGDFSHLIILNPQSMNYKSYNYKEINGYMLVDVISDTSFIVQDNNTNAVFIYNTKKSTLTRTNTQVKPKDKYWRWNERLSGYLSNLYKKIE